MCHKSSLRKNSSKTSGEICLNKLKLGKRTNLKGFKIHERYFENFECTRRLGLARGLARLDCFLAGLARGRLGSTEKKPTRLEAGSAQSKKYWLGSKPARLESNFFGSARAPARLDQKISTSRTPENN